MCNAQEILTFHSLLLKLKETGTLAHRKGDGRKKGYTNRSKDSVNLSYPVVEKFSYKTLNMMSIQVTKGI